MDIKILWMYSDIMDLYGDKGNIASLEYRCKMRGIDFKLHKSGLNEDIDFEKYDIVFIGGGADKEQRLLSKDLMRHKEKIINSLGKTFYILICGSYQLFGQYYIDSLGNKIEGLNILSYKTKAAGEGKRCIGNVVVDAILDGEKIEIVGFENHGGQTVGVEKPLGKVRYGNGNEFNSKFEGYYDGKILGTYIHGPLLPKNPKLTDFLIKKVLKNKGIDILLQQLDDSLENMAHDIMTNRCLK